MILLGVVYNYRTFLKIRTIIGLVENPPTHPPNPNKCLMLDVFMVLHIPGVNRLLPTISTVQGVYSSFIPTENGDERLDCMCMCCCNYHWPKLS